MQYKVNVPKPVIKILDNLSHKDKTKILLKLKILETNPMPLGSLKLKGYDNQYRIRIGNFRIRYIINLSIYEIIILDIAHRREIYKKK